MDNLTAEPFFTLLLSLTGAVYLLALQMIRRGIARLPELAQERKNADFNPPVSVIIPCRNEAEHIGAALEDLRKQDYSDDLVQIIVVDDRSDDGSGDIAREFQCKIPHLIVLRIDHCPENISPKKHALKRGLDAAVGEIILTTDADCRFQTGWISSLIANFTPDVGMVTGLTVFDRSRREPFWQRMQQLDYLSHSFTAAGAIGAGWAFNCNGSNLAMRREAFQDAGGYEGFQQVVTGDDTLLLQRIRQSGRWRIRFTADPRSLVKSWPEETPAEVFNQRLRWGSGGLSYAPVVRLFAVTTFIFFLTLFLAPLFYLSGWAGWLWMVFLLLKALQEGRVIAKGFQVFKLKPDWMAFLAMEIIHIPAILTFSIGGHIWGFRWKGQRFHRTKKTTIKEEMSA